MHKKPLGGGGGTKCPTLGQIWLIQESLYLEPDLGCGINLLRPVVIDCFKMFQFSSAVLSSGFAVRNSPDEGCARVLSPANKEEYKTGGVKVLKW